MNKKHNKKEPWRIIVFIIAVTYIIWMWVKKDIMEAYTAIPSENMIQLIATTIIVSIVKVIFIATTILFIKWLINKIKK